jgi:hypothetical protein
LTAEVRCDPLEQAGAVLSPVLAILFELHEPCSDKPVPQDVLAVHGPGRTGPGLVIGVGDGGDEGVVIHAEGVSRAASVAEVFRSAKYAA